MSAMNREFVMNREFSMSATCVKSAIGSTKCETPAVKIVRKTTVRPRQMPAAEKRTIPLTTYDLPYITFYYNQKLLLYGLPPERFQDAAATLTAALAAALDHFFPLAARLVQDDAGALNVALGGEDREGAELAEAEAAGVDLGDVSANEAILSDLVPFNGVMNLQGISRPLLAVQLTKLKDGMAVGCAFNHAILDGNSTWHFMAHWAALSSGRAPGPLPDHDRSVARSARVRVTLPASQAAHEQADPNPAPPTSLRTLIFSFSERTLQDLKSAVNSSVEKPFSVFQSLAAHCWCAVARARRLPPESLSVFAVFADCRRRLRPSLPDSYFGNLIQAIFAGAAVGDLLSRQPEIATGVIRAAIDGHDDASIRNRMEDYEANPKMFHYTDAGTNAVAVGSSPRFKVYDIDFGFGRPVSVRSGKNNKFDGMMYLYAARDSKGIDAEITLEAKSMQNLKEDADFRGVCQDIHHVGLGFHKTLTLSEERE